MPARKSTPAPTTIRIIGGRLGGRQLQYLGDPRTRPMKQRVREAIFNLLGPRIEGAVAIDLFAGTGALGLESLSRGARRSVLVERHFPTARLLEENAASLEVEDQVEVVAGDTFVWARRALAAGQLDEGPWVVFCSPPYDLYVERVGDMLKLVESFCQNAPQGSLFVLESDERFDCHQLICFPKWDVRHYAPAQIAIVELPVGD